VTKEIQIEGTFIRFHYQADEGAFAVAKIEGPEKEFFAVGPLGHICAGQHICMTGHWKFHPSFGEQFQVITPPMVDDPRSISGLITYLSSSAIKGLGKEYAKRIVDTFGLQTLDVLNNNPNKLTQVKGIGKKRLESIVTCWKKDQQSKELVSQLRGFSIGPSLCSKLIDKYGDDALAIIKRHPYILSKEIKGIGFKTADNIALSQGMTLNSPERAAAALLHCIHQAEGNGHCFLPKQKLLEEVNNLSVPLDIAKQQLDLLLHPREERSELIAPFTDDASMPIYRSQLHFIEKRITVKVKLLLRNNHRSLSLFGRRNLSKIPFNSLEKSLSLKLNKEQQEAVSTIFQEGLSVITGGPGTGKTTIIKLVIQEASRRGERWLLAAPTGRAAKRMQEATNHPAQTVHRLLNYNGHKKMFHHDADNPIDADAILIDEASMLDIWLMDALLTAIQPGCRLVLVGDVDQLPSVGPGQILTDIITSGVVQVSALKEVYRQAQDSNIVRNAHSVNEGRIPLSSEKDPKAGTVKDFYVLSRDTPQLTLDTLQQVISTRLPALGFSKDDIQILTPMHNGVLGTTNLNVLMQDVLNKDGEEFKNKAKRFRVGDRVIQVRNDYDNNIYNGDMGKIISLSSSGMYVQFDDRILLLAGTQINDLELAYAVSIHKSQGSEYQAVIILMHKAHWIMLRRNLLYTAITRAKKFCCIIGSEWAIGRAAEQLEGSERYTGLARRLSNSR
jgi:exodeoxyribonuclease V alpha subunit